MSAERTFRATLDGDHGSFLVNAETFDEAVAKARAVCPGYRLIGCVMVDRDREAAIKRAARQVLDALP